ncbi:hypothetical protein JQ616_00820 [Bradyrhizobium tropiciagri]|uniref:hypothetical protein n=1 Tax=Bradyrhizobium tropiciagri TaxID=312253 RepID=UPI001BAA3B9C|nr:hypothetical protein [Bradyrhizobium tropiciagri]MBR0893473.1 hypothetical protein [Bradyrhizobium tropiciagri]
MRSGSGGWGDRPLPDLLFFYFPFSSTFRFSSSFIFLIVGSRLVSPVVWPVVAGGPLLGTEVWSGSTLAGRVAVVLGGEAVWAKACAAKRKTPANKAAASVPNV